MMKEQLGKLEPVNLRDIWESETGDFTPWLADENNLKLLGDTIGVELELVAQEKSVGPFRADVLCKDTADDSWVLIENQLEKTDHTHLGQILTYAAGLKAVTIVWIAERFADEHRATIDWLNEITGEHINFFGLEVEVWQIGDSSKAPKFNVIASPNEWTKGGGGTGRIKQSELTDTKLLQLEYWKSFRNYLLDNHSFVKPTKALPQHWMNFAIGRSNFYMYTFVDTVKDRIGLRLCLSGNDAKAHFNLLKIEKEAIEADYGKNLIWDELPDKKTSYIGIYFDENPKTKEEWQKQHEILRDAIERMHKTLSDRIKVLDAGDYHSDEVEE